MGLRHILTAYMRT